MNSSGHWVKHAQNFGHTKPARSNTNKVVAGECTNVDDSTLSQTRLTVLPRSLLHDFRTPLHQIIGYSEMLSEQAVDEGLDGYEQDLLKISAAGNKLLELIDGNFQAVDGTVQSSTLTGKPGSLIGTEAQTTPAKLRHPAVSKVDPGIILVVDDNDMNRDVLSQRLKRHGHEVVSVMDGRQALAILKTRPFDVVLLDIMMPEMDGYEVLKEMKADDSLCHIPVIMISALQELDSVVKCLEMGADDYLFKPFNPTLLKARVLACLFKKRARDREMFHFAQLQQNFRRLEDLEKLRDDLTHMIIHDLRTPLTSLISGILTLEIIGDLNGDQREVLATSIQGGETLLSIINDLLDVEKLESGVMRLDYADLAYGDLVASAVGQVRSLVSSKELNLVLGIGPDLPNVCADANKIRRTMVNLLGNAIKFTPEGGTITIRANVNLDAQEMEFSVSDTGPGIAAEYFDRIFEKFGQIASTSGGVSSTGLGLTFCKLAVEAHKGHISVESYPPAGSTFNFAIPIAR